MIPSYTVAYINPDHFSCEIVTFTIECSGAQCWSFKTSQAFIDAMTAGDFDCVLVSGIPEDELLSFEVVLHDAGRYLPVINVTHHRDIPGLIASLRHGRSIWSTPADR